MAEYAEYIDRKLLVPDVDFDGDGNEDAVSIVQINSLQAANVISLDEAKHCDNGVLLKPVILCRNCDNLDKDISYCKELDKVIDNWSFYCANGIPKNK